MLELHERRRSAIRIARDIVEIVAIIAAGMWAFYVFVYENKIKPAFADPDMMVMASMQRLSEHNGLVGVSIRVQLRNIGTTQVHVLGYALSVGGQRVYPLTSPAKAVMSPSGAIGSASLEAFFKHSASVPVYGTGFVTTLIDPRSTSDLEYDPGMETESSSVFFVPAGRFDTLVAHVSLSYIKDDAPGHDIALSNGPSGLTLVRLNNDRKIQSFSLNVATLDLRAP